MNRTIIFSSLSSSENENGFDIESGSKPHYIYTIKPDKYLETMLRRKLYGNLMDYRITIISLKNAFWRHKNKFKKCISKG